MDDSIDIIAAKTDIATAFGQIVPYKDEFSGAFFEFPENSRNGHRFFVGVFRKLLTIFYRQARVSGSMTLSDAPAFLFSESYHLEILKGVNKHVQSSKRALVGKCLDPGGGMVQKPADPPVHHRKVKRRSAQISKLVKAVLSHPG